jgi:hypothetical protein
MNFERMPGTNTPGDPAVGGRSNFLECEDLLWTGNQTFALGAIQYQPGLGRAFLNGRSESPATSDSLPAQMLAKLQASVAQTQFGDHGVCAPAL